MFKQIPKENINQRSELVEKQELSKEAETKSCKYKGKQKANEDTSRGKVNMRRQLRYAVRTQETCLHRSHISKQMGSIRCKKIPFWAVSCPGSRLLSYFY